jgi:hypothetical protein
MTHIRELYSKTRNIPTATLFKDNQNAPVHLASPRRDSKALLLLIMAIGLLATVPVWAQASDTGTIHGFIRGPEGATVNLRSMGTSPGHASVVSITGPDGGYSFDNLGISNEYIVTVLFDQTNHSSVILIERARMSSMNIRADA